MIRILTATVLISALSVVSAQTTLQLILDASGSMFKQLDDGRYRIVAAKDVLANLIGALPASDDLNVGLRVYGAQRDALDEGACTDSELVVPMNAFDRSALLAAVRDTQARGATPIAYSLEQAAADFQGVDGDKLIVLVTDGEESCGGNVRDVAARLTASGLAVDLRIIGFDLSEDAAASFEGIGTFENARSAAELAAALGRAVEPVAQPEQEQFHDVTVQVTRAGAPAEGASVTFVSAVTDEPFELAPREVGTLTAALPAGSYRAQVEDALSDEPLIVANVVVTPEGENRYAYELGLENSVDLVVEPANPVAGGSVTVAYEGAPQGGENWITIVPSDAPDDVYLDWTYVAGASGSAELAIPLEPASLEARFHVELPEGGSRIIGRSDAFDSVAAEVSIEAPAEVVAGSVFQVEWTGPGNARDYLTIVPSGAAQGTYTSYSYTDQGSPAELTAPQDPGAYEVRYVAGQGDAPTLASTPIMVTTGAYSVAPPAEVEPRTVFDVSWEGPDNARDYITVVPQGAEPGTYLSYAYTRAGNPARITAPSEPGTYEVRYSTDQSPYPVLASATITVLDVEHRVEAPDSVAAGASFEVAWAGPGAPRDYVTIVPVGAPAGAYLDYAYTREGNPVTITAPDEPGAYEVRYQSDDADAVLASQPIRVE